MVTFDEYRTVCGTTEKRVACSVQSLLCSHELSVFTHAQFNDLPLTALLSISAYDPNNVKYRELSSYFWKTYTTYGGLWRDQPLWAYILHLSDVTPAVMTTEGTITKGGDLFETGGKLGWDNHVYV